MTHEEDERFRELCCQAAEQWTMSNEEHFRGFDFAIAAEFVNAMKDRCNNSAQLLTLASIVTRLAIEFCLRDQREDVQNGEPDREHVVQVSDLIFGLMLNHQLIPCKDAEEAKAKAEEFRKQQLKELH